MRALVLAPIVIAAMLTIAACGDAGSDLAAQQPDPSTRDTSPTATTGGGERRTCSAPETTGATTPIRIRFGETTLTGSLGASPTARALRERVPVTVEFADYGGVEKTAQVAALPMTGMPAGADPGPGTIGYYAPDRVLVLYYGDVGYFPGIADLGQFGDPDGVVADAEGAVTATIELDC